MKNKILSLLLALVVSTGLLAQDWNKAVTPSAFDNVNEAAQMAESIVKAAGMKANFKIAEAEVPNAMAVVHMGNRYILYNPRFISLLTRATGTKWAAISVLAHEIGHHLYSSSVNKGKTPLATELEADQFSGYVLQKMGATLQEAEVAMQVLGSRYATSTHPGRDDRVNSIATGWKKAGGVIEENTETDSDIIARNTQVREQPSGIYTQTRESSIPAQNIAATIYFNASPNADYIVTKRFNVVKVENEEMTIIARIKRSDDSEFPYIIYDNSGYQVYVDAYGGIYNSRGKVVGKMKLAG
jgi:hypothetical protein